jgi:hypothetical protein
MFGLLVFEEVLKKHFYIKGANYKYSDELILTMYTTAYMTFSPLRQTEGIFEDYVENFRLNLTVPDYSTMSTRLKKLNIKITDYRKNKNDIDDVEILIDSSSINIYNTNNGHNKENANNRQYQHYDQVRKMHTTLDVENKNVLSSSASS